jgi:hypothetical protein
MPITTEDVARLAYPYVKKCVSEAKDIGPFIKFFSRPFWFTLTRIGIEIAVALTAPKLLPVLEYLLQILPLIPEKYLVGIDKTFLLSFLELLKTPKEKMYKSVQDNLPILEKAAHYPMMTPEDLAEIVRRIENE